MLLYKIVFNEVTKIVNKHDPAGLITGGAPVNEYHDEINHIIKLLRDSSDKLILEEKIRNLFRSNFGPSVDAYNSCYSKMTDDLLEYAKRIKWHKE